MNKKLSVLLALALVAAVAVGGTVYGVAYAASQTGQAAKLSAQASMPALEWARRGLGQITILGDGQFTVQMRNGAVKVILVGAQTRYFDAHGTPIVFSDLQVGRWVAGTVVRSTDGPLARLVIQLPEGFDPTVRLIRHAGTVGSVDAAESTFELTTLQGDRLTFDVDENTLYMGQVYNLADLQTGMGAIVAAQQQADGTYLAERVTARQKPQVDVRAAGRVTGIDVSSFTILGRDGQPHTFQVTPLTHFRGPGLNGLRDLRLGRMVAVAAHAAGDGQLQALLVVGRK